MAGDLAVEGSQIWQQQHPEFLFGVFGFLEGERGSLFKFTPIVWPGAAVHLQSLWADALAGPLGRGSTSLQPWLGYPRDVDEDWAMLDKWPVRDSLRRSLGASRTWGTQVFLIQDSPAVSYRNLERPCNIPLLLRILVAATLRPGSTALWAIPESQDFRAHTFSEPLSGPTLTSPHPPKATKAHPEAPNCTSLPSWKTPSSTHRPGPRPQPASSWGWPATMWRQAVSGVRGAQFYRKEGRRRTAGGW